jgi:protein PhnA
MSLPNCPKCKSEYVYEDGDLVVALECAYELSADDLIDQETIVKNANGNILNDGVTVTIIKDLKIKGTSNMRLKWLQKLKAFVCAKVITILIAKFRGMAR